MRKVTPVSATKTRKVMRPLLFLDDDGSMDAAVVVGIMVLFVRGDVNERSPCYNINVLDCSFTHSLQVSRVIREKTTFVFSIARTLVEESSYVSMGS